MTAAVKKLKPVWRDNDYNSWVKSETDGLPCHNHISVCLKVMQVVNLDSCKAE